MMPQPKIQPIAGTNKYIPLEDYALLILGFLIRVPAGFIFDGASIPRAAWTFLGYTPFHPCVILAALIHDWLYLNHQVSREDADIIFKMLLLRNGVTPDAAQKMYLAVRLAGGFFWPHDEDDKRAIEGLRMIIDPVWKDHYHLPDMV